MEIIIKKNTPVTHPVTGEEGHVTSINAKSISIEFESHQLVLTHAEVDDLVDSGKLLSAQATSDSTS